MNRRQFLHQSVLFLAANAALPARAVTLMSSGASDKLVGGFATSESWQDDRFLMRGDQTGRITSLDLRTHKIDALEINCGAHGFSQSSLFPSVFATVAKWNQRGAIVDFKSRRVIQLRAPTHQRFFGHVAFSPNGRLYASAANIDGYDGYLLEIEPSDGRILRQVSTGGHAPHDFHFLDGETALIANKNITGESSDVTWLNVRTGKVLRRMPVERASHLAHWGEARLLVASNSPVKIGALFALETQTGQCLEAPLPTRLDARVHSEALSLAVIDERTVAVTTEMADSLELWTLGESATVSVPFKQETRGLVYYGNQLYMTMQNGTLLQMNLGRVPLEPPQITKRFEAFSNSKHLIAAKF